MATHVALLRAINVTGTGKLVMADLRALCARAGFTGVRTYIASGNVVFESRLGAARVKDTLEAALYHKLGKPCRVVMRAPDDLAAVVKANPFPDERPDRTLVLFLDEAPAKAQAAALADWPRPGGEELRLKGREIFIRFVAGQGVSRMKVPFADIGTGRNLNTVRALLAMARGEA